MTATIAWSINGGPEYEEVRELGHLPVMVRVSAACVKARLNCELPR